MKKYKNIKTGKRVIAERVNANQVCISVVGLSTVVDLVWFNENYVPVTKEVK